MTTPREDDTTSTPPHGDALREHGGGAGEPASHHGVPPDPSARRDDVRSEGDGSAGGTAEQGDGGVEAGE